MGVDVHSAITISALLALLMGISLRYALQDYSPMLWPSMRLWIFGTLLQPIAWVLYGLRGQMTDLVTIVLANALLSLSFARLLQAVRLFVGRPGNAALIYLPVLLVALAEIVFTYVVPGIRMRVVSVSLLLALQFALTVAALLDGSLRRRSYLLTAAAFALPACVLIVRAVYEGLRVHSLSSAFASTPMQSAVFGIAAFLPVISTLGFVLMCNDRLNRELVRQASLDPLTGISNRRALGEAAERAIAAASRNGHGLAVLLVDADHFKRINDEYGHAAGDSALKMLVEALCSVLRREDLFGRLGGEEFVVVLPEADPASARYAAERLRQAVERTEFVIQRTTVPLYVSIGIALYQSGHDDFATLLRRADQAMYAAKRAGRNCVAGPDDLALESGTPDVESVADESGARII